MTVPDPSDCTVLVVDDDPLIQATLSEILQELGYSVATAGSALEAVRAVARSAPSVVLLDVRMPGLDGLQFARSLRERDVATKILLMTGFRGGHQYADEIRADGYIEKPFDIEELQKLIAEACGSAAMPGGRHDD